MHKIYSKALDQTIQVDRVIGEVDGGMGPILVFTGGVHGNEPSGVFALHRVFEKIKSENIPLNGCMFGIAGNLPALEKSQRFEKQDLNRLWKGGNMKRLEYGELEAENEDIRQQIDIYKTLEKIIQRDGGPFYFVDLHTTSSQSIPFLTVNDSMLNRKFTKQFPVPIILGIEEYLDGPLLSYVNKLGYVAFGFEGGQHDDMAAIENHEAFIYLSLVYAGLLDKKHIDFDHYFQILAKNTIDTRNFYEIIYRHGLTEDDAFKMNPGFVNFQKVNKGMSLAVKNDKEITSHKNSRIFMPLYQDQGNDGYFLIKQIPRFFLRLSAVVRKWRLDKILPIFPGVKWASKKKHALYVNRHIARLFTKQIFHLLGYRSRELSEKKYYMRNREASARNNDYKLAPWMKK